VVARGGATFSFPRRGGGRKLRLDILHPPLGGRAAAAAPADRVGASSVARGKAATAAAAAPSTAALVVASPAGDPRAAARRNGDRRGKLVVR